MRIAFDVQADQRLKYWKRAEDSWSIVTAIAHNYLAIPAANVDVEHLFN